MPKGKKAPAACEGKEHEAEEKKTKKAGAGKKMPRFGREI